MGYVDWKGLLDQNVEVMGSAFKTDGNDMRMLGAFLCAAHGCVADKKKMDECKGILKDKFGVLSEFRGNLQVPLIIKMSMSENPEGYLQRISDIYEGLSAGYKLGNDLRLLAAVILCDNTTLENQKEVYVKTTEIYEKMKEQHSVMSGQNDIPFAALMAIQNEDAGIILGRAEDCYKLLGGRFKLSKGDILNVSRILSLSDSSADELCDSFLKMFDALKDSDVAIKGTQMAILGVLVNLGIDTDTAVSLIKSNEEMLADIKGFHGAFGVSSMNRRMYAAAITALDYSKGEAAVEGTVMSSVVSVILSIEMVAIMFIFMPALS